MTSATAARATKPALLPVALHTLFREDDDEEEDDSNESVVIDSSDGDDRKDGTNHRQAARGHTPSTIICGVPGEMLLRGLPSNTSDNTTTRTDDYHDEDLDIAAIDSGGVSGDASVVHVRRREVLGVLFDEQTVGGSISTQLWPSAEFLASFLIGLMTTPTTTTTTVDHDDHMTKQLLGSPSTNCKARQRQPSNNKDDERDPFRTVTEFLRQATTGNSGDNINCSLPTTDSDSSCGGSSGRLAILELGAGLGLTGLAVAVHLPVHVLLTDTDDGLPLLNQNATSNREKYRLGPDAVHVGRLHWGNASDAQRALAWYENIVATTSSSSPLPPPPPLLILGSDCVYWECLQTPLELTLYQLLSEAPPGSLCLLASARRWKRDTAFYRNLGKRTRHQSRTQGLQCNLLHEQVQRKGTTNDGEGESEQREILRIYAIQMVSATSKTVNVH